VIVYRVTPPAFAGNLSGGGARRHGGRWNPAGVPVLYTSNSTALCLLEILVNVKTAYLPNLNRVLIEIPEKLVCPEDPVFLAGIDQAREYGLRWLAEEQWLGLKVASSVLSGSPDGFNVILNPAHPDFREIRILENAPLSVDQRLLFKN
jgi:RES domain-containing protein